MKELISKPEVFNYGKLGKIRGLVVNKEPWFVARDVCNTLGYKNINGTIEKHVPEKYKKVLPIWYPLGGNQKTVLINESGLYRLILRSKKKEAEPFVDWVTSEVLPQIRKTGSYMATAEDLQSLEFVYSNFTKLIKKKTNTENIDRDKLSEEALEKTKFYEEIAISVIKKQISKGLQTYEEWQNIYYIFLNVLDNYI